MESGHRRPRLGDENVINLIDVTKIFNQGNPNEFTAVRGVSLTLDAGRITVLKGPSGSGKTSLLSVIGCMARPTSGRIMLSEAIVPASLKTQKAGGEAASGRTEGDGMVEVTSLPERFLTEIRRMTFGFIFQQFNLIKGITAIENVMIPAYPMGERIAHLKKRGLGLLDLFNLSQKGSSKIEWLSGGETQRVAIARALINNPAILIADEPTAHLDTGLSREFMATMERLRAEGRTVIIASHDPIVCDSAFIDRVVEMRDGLVVDSGA
jgi:putative ABC transport system ATP-binding protein